MLQLIILLLALAALAIVAVQNMSTSVALVLLGSIKTAAIPFGLLVVGAVAIGALLTLTLYGLVGLQRAPESKYRPVGRRVPYPDSPDSGSSGSSYGGSGVGYGGYKPATEPAYSSGRAGGRSTAFVNDSSPPNTLYDAGPGNSNAANAYPSPEPRSNVERPGSEKKKSNRAAEQPLEGRIGDDWGDLRTAEHLNSWNLSSEQTGKRGFLEFIGLASGPPAAVSTREFETGWDDGLRDASVEGYADREEYRPVYDDYDDELDRGWEDFERDRYEAESAEGYGYAPDGYGESFADSSRNSSGDSSGDFSQRRVYRDGLYDDRAGYRDEEGPYRDSRDYRRRDDYPEDDEGPYDERGRMAEEGVYEADYRVIVPPSKPLDDAEDDYP
jgi:uncharacterized integral membrane protein